MNTMGSNITWGLMLTGVIIPLTTSPWSNITVDHFIYAWIASTTLIWIVRSWIRSAS